MGSSALPNSPPARILWCLIEGFNPQPPTSAVRQEGVGLYGHFAGYSHAQKNPEYEEILSP